MYGWLERNVGWAQCRTGLAKVGFGAIRKTGYPQVWNVFQGSTAGLLFVAFFGFLSTGCGEKTSEFTRVLRVRIAAEPESLDPAHVRSETAIRLCQQVYEGLVALGDSSLQPRPALAKRWTVSQNGRRYTFTLRPGIRFQPNAAFGPDSTRLLVAQDFVYSLTRIVDPAVGSAGAWVFLPHVRGARAFHAGQADTVAGWWAPNDSTLVIELVQPFAPFLQLLAMPYAFVVPKEVAQGAAFGRKPCGTGPFRLYKWATAQHLVFHRSPNYWAQTKPQLDAVYARVIANLPTAYALFQQGELDVLEGLDAALVRTLLTEEGRDRLKPHYAANFDLQATGQLSVAFVGCLVDTSIRPQSPVRDVHYRRLLAAALQRKALAKNVMAGLARPLHTFAPAELAPPFLPQHAHERTPRHIHKPRGAMPAVTLLVAPEYKQVGEYLQAQWKRAGLNVNIETAQAGALRTRVINGEVDLWLATWVADYPHPENFYALFHSGNVPPAGPNRFRYRNPQADVQIEALARGEIAPEGPATALENWVIREQAVAIPLFQFRSLRLIQKRVKGLHLSPNALKFDLRKVRVE